MTDRYFRVHFLQTDDEHTLVKADSAEEARAKIERWSQPIARRTIKVVGVKEEFGWQSEGDGIVSRKG